MRYACYFAAMLHKRTWYALRASKAQTSHLNEGEGSHKLVPCSIADEVDEDVPEMRQEQLSTVGLQLPRESTEQT